MREVRKVHPKVGVSGGTNGGGHKVRSLFDAVWPLAFAVLRPVGLLQGAVQLHQAENQHNAERAPLPLVIEPCASSDSDLKRISPLVAKSLLLC
jgi:hypothetical protein